MSDPGKPASVILFAGMTGVGKTELAKRIAEICSSSRRLHTYTMANFTEPHSVSGIIGVPPGYVGFENGGRLINELNADPYSVFLLDEAEKAHPNVWKPFLNLFDEGWIVDQLITWRIKGADYLTYLSLESTNYTPPHNCYLIAAA